MQALGHGKKHNKGWNPEPGKPGIKIRENIIMTKVTFLL